MTSITVVVPTCNESANVAELVDRLGRVRDSAGIDEVIFVDDSSDDTPDAITRASALAALPVRLLHRPPEGRIGGLSGAVVSGIVAAASPWVVVMDGDLQHPPEDVPRLVRAADTTDADTVVASRYCAGGTAAGLAGRSRRWVSRGSAGLATLLFPWRLRRCSDIMTGFFAVRRGALDIERLRPRGFKILLEILVRHRLRVTEVPFTFGERTHGESKASMRQGLRFLTQLARLRWDTWWAGIPMGEVCRFGVVGVANLVLDVGLFNLLLAADHRAGLAKLISTSVATVASYLMNRHWTWPHRARSGLHRELPAFFGLSAVALGIAEICLWVSHDVLQYTSTLADNVAANVVGLGLGMAWRFWSFRRWVFPLADALTSG